MLLLKNNAPPPTLATHPAGLSLAGMEPAGPRQSGPSGWENLCPAISNPPGPRASLPRQGCIVWGPEGRPAALSCSASIDKWQ